MDHLIRKYSSVIEAESAKAYLDAHGVPSQLPDMHAISMQPHLIDFFGGVRLLIHKEDLEKAEGLLMEVEKRSHLVSLSPEDVHPQAEANKKRAQVRNLARFVLLVFLVYYAFQIFKKGL